MIYDTVIIGGGPAGMMAAVRASENGARVLVLEKNECLGKKLLLTGHGRCNLTNVSADDKNTMPVYGKNYKFLYSAFNQFGVEKTLDFFQRNGLDTKIEDNGRVFPQSDRALDVRLLFDRYLEKNNVEVMHGACVKEIVANKKSIKKIVLDNKKEILAKNFIIATGGKSYPGTGSTGDAYDWLAKLGHSIVNPRPALTPVVVKERFVIELEGATLQDVEIAVYHETKKIISRIGDLLITAEGLSGPTIIDLSRHIGELLPGKVFVKIDFFPGVKVDDFEKKIQNDFHSNNNKMFKNYLSVLVPPKIIPTIIKLSGIAEKKLINSISKTERRALVRLFKEFTFSVSGLKGFEKAMITAGGVDTRQVDPKTMRSRLYDNLFFAGEILDLDGPSGGYNLQICWSTGYVAGELQLPTISFRKGLN